MKISIEMEPRELHELIILGVATMGPDLPEPPTPVKSTRPKAITAKKSKRKAPTTEIRVWAKANGYHVSDKGIIPKDVKAAWEAREAV